MTNFAILARLTGKWRWRVAILLAAAYALCLVAPTAVLAFGGEPGPTRCLTGNQHGMAAVHVHEDGSPHQHGNNDGEPQGKCCGLFCLSALSPDTVLVVSPQVYLAAVVVPRPQAMSGRETDRIDRPPRASLSL